MNTCPEDLKESFLKQIPYMNEPYVRIDKDNRIILDRNMAYQDIVNYKIVNFDYCSRVNMANVLRENNIKVVKSTSLHVEGELQTKPLKMKSSFKELFDIYCEIMTPGKFSLAEDERLTFIRMYKPLVIEAYQKLGPEKVKALKYKVSNIKREITAQCDLKEQYKITKMLSQSLPLLEYIPLSRIKKEIKKAFAAIGKEGDPSAIDVGH